MTIKNVVMAPLMLTCASAPIIPITTPLTFVSGLSKGKSKHEVYVPKTTFALASRRHAIKPRRLTAMSAGQPIGVVSVYDSRESYSFRDERASY